MPRKGGCLHDWPPGVPFWGTLTESGSDKPWLVALCLLQKAPVFHRLGTFCLRCDDANFWGTSSSLERQLQDALGRHGSTQVWGSAEVSRQGCVAPGKAPDGDYSNEITPIIPGCQVNICSWHIGLWIFQIHTPKSRCVCVMNSTHSARNYWGLKKGN